MKKLFLVAIALFALGTAVTSAQSPSEQIGFGASLGWFDAGGHVVYAIDPAIHVGTQFGLVISDGNTNLTFAPYFKFLMKGTKEFKPYVIGQFYVTSGGSQTNTGIRAAMGGEYFVTPSFGLFAQIALLDIPFATGSKAAFGIAFPSIGFEWFME